MSANLKILSPAMEAEIQELIDRTLNERLAVQPDTEGYLTVKQAAQLSGKKEQTIRKWLREKRIKKYGAGRSVLVKLSDIVREKD